MTEVLFFVLLFTLFATYYICFLIKYSVSKCQEKPQTLKQHVTIVESRVRPINYKLDFLVPDIYLQHESKARNTTEQHIARLHGARHVANEIEKLIIKDKYNQLFKLIQHKSDSRLLYNKEQTFTICFSIIPEHERGLHYGSKLI